MEKIETIVYSDIFYLVVYTYEEGVRGLKFTAQRIRTLLFDNSIDELDEGNVLDGYVKFDGCINTLLEEGYAHYCGMRGITEYFELIIRICNKARELGCNI